MKHSRHEHHDQLRHQEKFQKVQAVKEALRLGWDRQAVDVVQPYGWQGQGQDSGGPRQTPATGLPVLGHSQPQEGPTVPGQRRERDWVQTNPLCATAPLHGQSNGPVGRIRTNPVWARRKCASSHDRASYAPITWNRVKIQTRRGLRPSAAVQCGWPECWAADQCWWTSGSDLLVPYGSGPGPGWILMRPIQSEFIRDALKWSNIPVQTCFMLHNLHCGLHFKLHFHDILK